MMQRNERSGRNAKVFVGGRAVIARCFTSRSRVSLALVIHRVVIASVVMGMMATGAFGAGQDRATKPPTLRYDELLVAFTKKYDTNRDGKLDELEFSAAVEDLVQRALIKKYDINRDGRLDAKERAVMRQEMEGIKRAVVMKYDANHSGALSGQEQAAANRDLLKQVELALPKPDRSGSK
ncbi:MAG: hypothetical protein HZA91_06910 [Verrucomicrobia bacterium]|nr:hypothetical protein [Verrucomicrobiota bacterium]